MLPSRTRSVLRANFVGGRRCLSVLPVTAPNPVVGGGYDHMHVVRAFKTSRNVHSVGNSVQSDDSESSLRLWAYEPAAG